MKVLPPVVEKVREFLQKQKIHSESLVVAVSGGADSVALLLALVNLQASQDACGLLAIAHLNHKLRGQQSDADEAFVRQLHASLSAKGANVFLHCKSVDVAAQARAEGENVESVARRLRYEWLGQVASDTAMAFVATGHTADDQAETVLFRLLRGTGLKGLSGIAPRRPLKPGVELFRPLLAVTRQEILEYLESEGQSYCLDSTNADLRYTRNRIRHELLPRLARDYNPAVVSVLGRLGEQAAAIFRQRETFARELLGEIERPRAGDLLILDQARLSLLPRHLIREVFHYLWTREGWPMSRMAFRDWDRVAGLALGEDSALDLPDGIHVRRVEHVVQIGRGS